MSLSTDRVYAMPLCDIPLEPSYKNPIYFDETGRLTSADNKSPTRATFFTKYSSSYKANGSGYHEVNFSLGNTVRTSITLEITKEYQLNANYMHIIWSDIKGAKGQKLPNDLFYFISSVEQITGNVYKYMLVLDVITTYSPYLDIRGNKPLFTERKHCNRWGEGIYDMGTNVHYPIISGKSSDALLSDDIDGRFKAEVLVKQEELQFIKDDTSSDSNLYEGALDIKNTKLWLYVFVLRSGEPDGYQYLYRTKYSSEKGGMYFPFNTYCAPISENNKVYHSKNLVGAPVSNTVMSLDAQHLYNKYVDDVNLLGIRISNIPPFTAVIPLLNYDDNEPRVAGHYATIKGEYKTVSALSNKKIFQLTETYAKAIGVSYFTDRFVQREGSDTIGYLRLIEINYNLLNNYTEPLIATVENDLPIISDDDLSYTKPRNLLYEPKLYTTPFCRYGIKLQGSEFKEYDKLMAYDSRQDAIITKQGVVSPDSQKVFYTINSGVYKNYYKLNQGLTFSPAYALPMINDVYKNFLATQSSQQLQSMVMGSIGGMAQAGIGLATMGLGTGASAVKGTGGLIGGVLGTVNSITGYYAKRQDMQNAPDSASKMGQNILSDTFSNNPQECYIVEYEMIDKEKNMVADYFYSNGYKVIRNCVFKWEAGVSLDDYMITRTLFNHLKINDEGFMNDLYAYEDVAGVKYEYPISPEQRRILGEIFANGVSLWTLYGITSGDDVDKYYLSKQYENAELKEMRTVGGRPEIVYMTITHSVQNNEGYTPELELRLDDYGYYFDLPTEYTVEDGLAQWIYNQIMGTSVSAIALREKWNVLVDVPHYKLTFINKENGVKGNSSADFDFNDFSGGTASFTFRKGL